VVGGLAPTFALRRLDDSFSSSSGMQNGANNGVQQKVLCQSQSIKYEKSASTTVFSLVIVISACASRMAQSMQNTDFVNFCSSALPIMERVATKDTMDHTKEVTTKTSCSRAVSKTNNWQD
jgi:hypothetical protein